MLASCVPLWNRLFGVRWICRGGQLTAIQDAASRTPREECPAALGQAGRPGPDGRPVHGAIAEPDQSVGVLRGLGHLLPLHELLRWGRWRWVGTTHIKIPPPVTSHLSAGSFHQTSVLYKCVKVSFSKPSICASPAQTLFITVFQIFKMYSHLDCHLVSCAVKLLLCCSH